MKTIARNLATFSLITALAACAAASNRTTATITVDGANYTTVTRVYGTGDSAVTTGDVIYGGVSYGCDTSRPGACEAVVRQLRNSDINRGNESVVDSSSFVISGMN